MTKFSQEKVQNLREAGWVKLTSDFRNEAKLRLLTLNLAKWLGRPARGRSLDVVEAIIPKDSNTAPPASLSKKYGLDAFPFHIDTAHWTVPARFLILTCVNSGEVPVPTLLVNRNAMSLSSHELQLARSSVFLIRNGKNSFYSGIFGIDCDFIRYDPGCMEPQTSDAAQALQLFSYQRIGCLAHKIYWQAGDVVIIDNWHVLHARAAVNENSSNRFLLRCLVS